MKKHKFTYQKSGVNINASDKFIKFISNLTKKSNRNKKSNNIGNFGSITTIPKKYKNPLLIAGTDGVGTKLEIANTLKKFDTIGIDLVAMCVNDVLVQGAKPLIFLDYMSIGKIDLPKMKNIIKGIHRGCLESECQLVGGETAEMPGTYSKNKFDLAGFALGVVEKNKLLEKEKIKVGDCIMAIPSNGLHSNGYSLIRSIISKKRININNNKFLKKELIKPTKIYVKEISKLLEKNLINGCCHITGGGLKDNLQRIIPNGLSVKLNLKKIKVSPIFKWVKKNNLSDYEMLKTFNCGVGFCIILNKKNIKKVQNYFKREYKPYVLGEISKGNMKVSYNGKIRW